MFPLTSISLFLFAAIPLPDDFFLFFARFLSCTRTVPWQNFSSILKNKWVVSITSRKYALHVRKWKRNVVIRNEIHHHHLDSTVSCLVCTTWERGPIFLPFRRFLFCFAVFCLRIGMMAKVQQTLRYYFRWVFLYLVCWIMTILMMHCHITLHVTKIFFLSFYYLFIEKGPLN